MSDISIHEQESHDAEKLEEADAKAKTGVKGWFKRFAPLLAVIAIIVALVAATMPAWLPALKSAINGKTVATAPVTPTPTPTPVAPTPVAEPMLVLGSTGQAVSTLQTRLNVWDVQPPLVVNGSFNAATLAAVKAFQAAEHLTADGVVGPNTWTALEVVPPAGEAAITYTVPKPAPITKPAPVITVPVATPADLSISVQPGVGGATAGANWYDLTFTNTAKHAVTMTGFPTVAVGVNGVQVGASAVDVIGVTPVLVTLAPGDTAYSLLKVTDVGAIGIPQPEQLSTSQLLVEIPGSASQVVVPLTLTSAANGTSFLTIYPISLNAGA